MLKEIESRENILTSLTQRLEETFFSEFPHGSVLTATFCRVFREKVESRASNSSVSISSLIFTPKENRRRGPTVAAPVIIRVDGLLLGGRRAISTERKETANESTINAPLTSVNFPLPLPSPPSPHFPNRTSANCCFLPLPPPSIYSPFRFRGQIRARDGRATQTDFHFFPTCSPTHNGTDLSAPSFRTPFIRGERKSRTQRARKSL